MKIFGCDWRIVVFFIIAHLLVFFAHLFSLKIEYASCTSMEEDLLVAFVDIDEKRTQEPSALALLEAFALEENWVDFQLDKDSKNCLHQPQEERGWVAYDGLFSSTYGSRGDIQDEDESTMSICCMLQWLLFLWENYLHMELFDGFAAVRLLWAWAILVWNCTNLQSKWQVHTYWGYNGVAT